MTWVTSLGVDVSTRRIAVGWVSSDGDVGAVSADVDPKLRGAQRMRAIFDATVKLAEDAPWTETQIVVVEDPNTGASANKPLLQAVGACLAGLWGWFPNAVILELPIGTWKKLALGNGAAKKGAIWEGALAYGGDPQNQDEADAICIAVAGLRKLEQP